MNKYETLVKVLDYLRASAESNQDLYFPELGKVDIENARSRALIQFFLKSNFGITSFSEREKLITDGPQDGGLDAYYFDDRNKKVFFIQSKFRNNPKNYEKSEIKNEEIWKIDLERIVKGETTYINGKKYNKSVLDFQKEFTKRKLGKDTYENVVLIVANVTDSQKKYVIQKHFPKKWKVQVFNYIEVYNQLLFPYITESFFNEEKLCIEISLPHEKKEPMEYEVSTQHGNCLMRVLFVPTQEIGRIFYNYKNSILKHNPRGFLGMKKEGINQDIEDSILNKKSNDFVLLNNGITMLSTCAEFDGEIGKKGFGQIFITNPQIINGGQTSFTLGEIYERVLKGELKKNIFDGKEVLLKIIVQSDMNKYNKITSDVSLSTNSQQPINEGDLKSNHISQVDIQKYLYDSYGLFYERKRGEFFSSIKNSYIKKEDVVDRNNFIKTAYSSNFPNVTKNPKNMSERIIFSDPIFNTITNEKDYKKFAMGYLVFREVQKLKRQARKPVNDWFFSRYGYALRYGDVAVTMISTYTLSKTDWKKPDIVPEILKTLDNWKKFEKKSFSKKENVKYFNKKLKEQNPIGYYKSDNLITDLIDYFT